MLSNKDKIVLVFSIFAIIFVSLIYGNFYKTFTSVLLLTVIFSTVYGLIHVKNFTYQMISVAKDAAFILSFSLLTTIIIVSLMPYLIIRTNTITMLQAFSLYIFPSILVFFFSFYLYAAIIHNHKIKWIKSFGNSLFGSVIIVALIFTSVTIFYGKIQTEHSYQYQDQIQKIISQMDNLLLESELEIAREINAYNYAFTQDVENKKMELSSSSVQICHDIKCSKIITEKLFHLLKTTIHQVLHRRISLQVSNFETVVKNQLYLQNFSSKEEYLESVRSSFELLNANINIDAEHDILESIEELPYDELRILDSKIDRSSIVAYNGQFFSTKSIFFNSINYVFDRIDIVQNLRILALRVSIFTYYSSRSDDIIYNIHSNRNVIETPESKIIRYLILNEHFMKVDKLS